MAPSPKRKLQDAIETGDAKRICIESNVDNDRSIPDPVSTKIVAPVGAIAQENGRRRAMNEQINKENVAIPEDSPPPVSLDSETKISTATGSRNVTPSQPEATEKSDDESSSSSSSSSSEESTILSEWTGSSIEEDMKLPTLWVSARVTGIERLEKILNIRQKRLKKLCHGQPPAYVHLLKENEMVAGKIKIAEYMKKHPTEDHDIGVVPPESPMSNDKKLSYWKGILQFELIHMLPNAYIVCLVCAVHSAFFGVLECLCRMVYESFVKPFGGSNEAFYTSLGFLGLILLRFNGGLVWYTRSSSDYNRIKMEMSNRFKLGMFDAKLLKRIKDNLTGSAFSMFGYYFICIGINYFYYHYHSNWMTVFGTWFDEVWGRSIEAINAELRKEQEHWADFYDLAFGQAVETPDREFTPSCEYSQDMVSNWMLKLFWPFWCSDTSVEYKSVEIWYHVLMLSVSGFLALRVGQNMLTLCD